MVVLRIEHTVTDFDTWKAAFDSDPLGREQSGVRRYRILRPADDAASVAVDLEFDDANGAEAFRNALRDLWRRVDVIRDPRARLFDVVESGEY
jgi:hypothetical protein